MRSSGRTSARPIYVKIRRSEAWYGIRIAAHLPYYASSADYEQILVPVEVAGVDELADAEADLIRAIHHGGRIVADPQETAFALLEALRAKRNGTNARGEQRSFWRWDEETLGWRLLRVDGRPATAEDVDRFASRHAGNAPDVRLTGAEQSSVRHRLNLRAEWSHEEMRKFAPA